MRSTPAASARRPPSVSAASAAREVLPGSAASARHNTAGLAADSTDCPGREGRARGGSHAQAQPARPRGRQRRVRAVNAKPASGLTPRTRTDPRPGPYPGARPERGRLSRGISESISVPGRGARAAAVPERLESETGAAPVLPHPGATSTRADRTFNSSERRRVPECGRGGPSLSGGGRSRRKYGGGLLRPAETPLSWGGGNAEEGSRPPLSRTPPPQFCLDGCSREPAPQLPFSPSFSPRCLRLLLPLLPPAPGPPRPAPPRRAARVPCVMASRPAGPPRAALGRCRSLAHVRPGGSWCVPPATGRLGGQRPARPLRGRVSRPFCPSASSTSPRAGGAVEQVSPPRMGGVAGAAPDVVVDAGP